MKFRNIKRFRYGIQEYTGPIRALGTAKPIHALDNYLGIRKDETGIFNSKSRMLNSARSVDIPDVLLFEFMGLISSYTDNILTRYLVFERSRVLILSGRLAILNNVFVVILKENAGKTSK
jgi:hypothetical protein